MKWFKYNGKNTKTIIDTPLILCPINSIDNVDGSTLSNVTGETSISRQTPNEYGVIASPLQFEYGLLKKDKTVFTDEEQVIVENWLTSRMISSELRLFNSECNDNSNIEYEDYYYCGKFLNTKWHIGNKGYYAVSFSFIANTAYPYKKKSITYDKTKTENIINCNCVNENSYIYPVIKYTRPIVSDNPTEPNFSIKNKSDNNGTMSFIVNSGIEIIADTEKCMIYDVNTNLFKFGDVGLGDVGELYWFRLINGENKIEMSGDGDLIIEYKEPYKKVGGWIEL